jgi:hypothetical protein
MWSEELAQRDRDARGKPLVARDWNGAVVCTWTPYEGMFSKDIERFGLASYAAVESECNYKGWTLHVAVVR